MKPGEAFTAAADPQEPVKLREPYTRDWPARQFVKRYGHEFRFVYDEDEWWRFDGKRWRRDFERAAEDRIREMFRIFRSEGALQDNDALQKLGLSINDHRVRECLFFARSDPAMTAGYSFFDRKETCGMFFNVENGTIDLKTGTLLPHRPMDHISRLAPVAYDPEAKCPRFDKFLTEIFSNDINVIDYLWRIIGYCLTASVKEQCWWNFFGYGANGKGTLVGVLHSLLGEYATSTDIKTFTVQKYDRGAGDATPHLAALRGTRLVTAVEPRDAVTMDDGVVKQWTGGDPVVARHLHHEPFTFYPECKIVIASNTKPTVKDTSEGFWRRVRLLDFPVHFNGTSRDSDLLEKLRGELPGILNRAMAGCREWQEIGLIEPQSVIDATSQYRDEEDVVGRWLEEATIRSHENRDLSSRLFDDYKSWCKVENENPADKHEWDSAMSKAGHPSEKIGGKQYRLGLRLRAEGDQ